MARATMITAVSVVFLAFLLGWRGQDDGGRDFTADVVKGDLAIEVELSGTFVADNKDEIRMEPKAYRGDLIITKLIPEGRAVKTGDVLMEFDQSSLEDAIDEANDEVAAKQVDLDKAQADLDSWRIDQERQKTRWAVEVEKARKDLEKAKADAEIELDDKKKEVEDADQRLRDAEIDLEQLLQLYEERELHTSTENILINRERRSLEDTRRSVEKTKKQFAIWQQFEQNRDVEDKQLDYDDKLAEVQKGEIQAAAEKSEKEAEVTKAITALTKAQKRVSELQEDSQSLRVIAPRDGIVFYGSIGEGDMFSDIIIFSSGGSTDEMKVGGRVRTFQVLITVASMDKLSVQMKALEGDIQHLESGLPMLVRPDAFPALTIDGEITKVDQVASRTALMSEVREFTVRGTYDGRFPQLRSGMNCRVTVLANKIPDCIQVPVLAVFREGDEHYCLIESGGKRSRRPVVIGAANGTMVEIREGLREGEKVALYNPAVG